MKKVSAKKNEDFLFFKYENLFMYILNKYKVASYETEMVKKYIGILFQMS